MKKLIYIIAVLFCFVTALLGATYPNTFTTNQPGYAFVSVSPSNIFGGTFIGNVTGLADTNTLIVVGTLSGTRDGSYTNNGLNVYFKTNLVSDPFYFTNKGSYWCWWNGVGNGFGTNFSGSILGKYVGRFTSNDAYVSGYGTNSILGNLSGAIINSVQSTNTLFSIVPHTNGLLSSVSIGFDNKATNLWEVVSVGSGNKVDPDRTSNQIGYGTAVGCGVDARNGGVGVGNFTTASYFGVAVGYDAIGDFFGTAIGNNAIGDQWGVAIGNGAEGEHGSVAIGNFAFSQVTNHIAIGNYASTPTNGTPAASFKNVGEIGQGYATNENSLHWMGVKFADTNGAYLGYKVWQGILSQTNTLNPYVVVFKNTLGGTVVWARSSSGIFSATLNGAFPVGKTVATVDAVDSGNGFFRNFDTHSATVNTLQLSTTDTSFTPFDGCLYLTFVEIRVYP